MVETSLAETLLTCLRLDQGEEQLARLQTLTAADWQMVVAQAHQYSVTPLLYSKLKNLPFRYLFPPASWQELHESYVTSAGRNLLLYRELAEILKALGPAGIPVILLKGLHLAKWIYPEMALRPMADIDLLLRVDDLLQAASILQNQGYHFIRAFNMERELRKHQHIPALWQPGKAPVELHWHIATPGSLPVVDPVGFFERAQPVEVAGAPGLLLSPEDLLLHTGYHLLQEEFILGLKRLYDIAALTGFYGGRLDWLQLQSRAEQWNFSKGLFLVLHLASALLDAAVPGDFMDQLRPPDFTPQLDALARERVLSVDISRPELNPNLTRLRRRQPWRSKAARLFGILFPYPEYVAAKLSLPRGSKVGFYYYLVWLKYLTHQYGWQFWRVMRNDETAVTLAQSENALSDWLIAG